MTEIAPEHIEEGGLMMNVESRRAAAPPIVLAAMMLSGAAPAVARHARMALIGLGLVIVIAPSLVPGLTPPTM